MPVYDFRCEAGHRFEDHVAYERRDEPLMCKCGQSAKRLPTFPQLAVSRLDYSYDCPVTGKHITSKHQHEENLKLHGCHVLETGEKEANERSRAQAEAELERKIDATVEKSIDNMSGEKREQLAKELSSGIDVQVARN